MGDIRSIKATARAAVHDRASRPVYVITDAVSGSFVEKSVRIHRQASTHGGLQGTSFHYAEMEGTDAKMVVAAADASAFERGTIVMVGAGEGYTVDRRMVADGGYVTFPIIPLTESEAAAFPYPPEP